MTTSSRRRERIITHESLLSKSPIMGTDDRVALVGGMAIDITDQRKAEVGLRQSEERFRNLLEQAPFSIQVFSRDAARCA